MRIIIFLPILLLFLFSCERSHHYDYPLSNQLKDYVLFQANSKWIFQNDSTMAKDTVVVLKAETFNTCRQIDTEVDCSENFEITYHSSFYGSVFYDRTLAYPPGSSNQVVRSTQEFEILPNDDFPIYNNNNQFFSSLMVNGITYMNIFKLRLDYYQPGTQDYRAADFYWAKNVGLIKKVLYEGDAVKSWSLIEKEVHQ